MGAPTDTASWSCESIQVGEKAAQNYHLETTNPGGHSSIPIRDNAIYELADALTKVRDYEFPVKLTDTTRAFFAKAGASRKDELGDAMVALSKNPDDQAAEAIVSKDRSYHSMLRTTCVATLLDGGHANNALPQRASANINCRIFPGETVDEVQATLVKVIGDPGVKMTAVPPDPADRHPAAAGSEDHRSRRKAGGEILPRRAARSDHVDGRDRWHLSRSHRNSGLWRSGRLG